MGGSEIRVIHMNEVPEDIDKFGVAIFVGGEDDLDALSWSPKQESIFSPYLLAEHCISLLAPILPVDRPIRGLELHSSGQLLSKRVYDAIIDTALARSPVRYRPRRGSILPRIADLIVDAALLCSSANALTRFLRTQSKSNILGMLTLGMESRRSRRQEYEADLSSENTWGSSRPHSRGASTMFSSSFEAFTIANGKSSIGNVEIRQRTLEFKDFARHVIETIVPSAIFGDRNLISQPEIEPAVPPSILGELEFEGLVAGFSMRSARQRPFAVTAETPKLSALVNAQREGWEVTRYTDVDAISAILASPGGSSYGPTIPFELKVPRLRRLDANQYLFSRGVFKADLILEDQPSKSSEYEIEKGEFRRPRKYRMPPSYDTETSALAIPKASGEVRASSNFTSMEDLDWASGQLTAWSRPASGTTRFAFVSGVLPIQILEFAEDEVPHSSLFWVDGTEAAVRSLLQSRVFYVWLRAIGENQVAPIHSWSRSLEAFPIVPPFSVQRPIRSRPYLFLDGTTRMTRLARETEALPTSIDRPYRRRISLYGPTVGRARKELDEAVLSAYGIKERATDVDILVRLIELNDRLKAAPIFTARQGSIF